MSPVALVVAGVLCALLSWGIGGRFGRNDEPAAEAPGSLKGERPRLGGGGLVGVLSRHRWARRSLGAMAALLVLGATVAAAYPFLTDRYTETLQHRLRREFTSAQTRSAYLTRQVPVGSSLTRLEMPAIGVDTIVVEGTTDDALRAGAGHYPETPLPCEGGNVAIAGHRVTFGKPFNRLAEMKIGDTISLETPVGSCVYRVTTAPFEVDPKDVNVADPKSTIPTLTLTTCHPEGSARQRLVVKAERVHVKVQAQ